jgi:hypothetical protein
MEQVLDWLNENELRAFPLLDSSSKVVTVEGASWSIPDNFILDLQLVITSSALVDQNNQAVPVVLSKLAKTQTANVKVSFALGSQEITEFTLSEPATQNYPVYVRNSDGNLIVFGPGALDFLALTSQPIELATSIPVEPSTCTQFNGAWLGVSSFRTSPEKVSLDSLLGGPYRVYEPSLPLENVSTPSILQGDVNFLEGYNCRVKINNSRIDLEIGSSYGLRMNCTTSFIAEEYLDCDDIVSFINGIPPDSSGSFRLTAGSNISITKGTSVSSDFYDPMSSTNHEEASNAHTLFVGLNFQATDICAPVNIVP